MEKFLERYGDRVKHILSAPDRMIFRGTLRDLCRVEGMGPWLGWQGILLKNLGAFAKQQSDRLKLHAMDYARKCDRPYEYLASPKISKHERAQHLAYTYGVKEGLICVFGAVESCMSFDTRKNPHTGYLELCRRERKGLFLYFYFRDRDFGFMHVRLSTWLPFELQVYVNGQEWLARQMDHAGLSYERQKNCFSHLEDPVRTQALVDEMLRTSWPEVLNRFARIVNPLLQATLGTRKYYWTIREGEYATDVVFHSEVGLRAVYSQLTRRAIEDFHSEDVLRFLGHRPRRSFTGRVESTLGRRPEGVRVRHQVNENWIKMYDKEGTILRIETTINNPERFTSFRQVRSQGQIIKKWGEMRHGVSEMYRRSEISRKANARYLDALAAVPEDQPASAVLDPASRPVVTPTQRFRALRPVSLEDADVFAGILRGEFLLSGIRNRELRALLYPSPSFHPMEEKRRAGKITRYLRLLRAHGLVHKIPKTSRYVPSPKGVTLMTTALRLRHCDVNFIAQVKKVS